MSENDKENLRKEYQVCFDNWRFFVGLRFTVLAFFLTLNSGLLYAFDNSKKELFTILLPIVGLSSVIAGWIIENRTSQMYFTCIQRAKAIESTFVPENADATKKRRVWPWAKNKPNVEEEAKSFNLGHILDNRCPTTMFQSQKWGIRIVYIALLALWLLLIFSQPPFNRVFRVFQ